MFFETKVNNSNDYANALGALAPIWGPDPLLNFADALIIRGQTCPDYSTTICYMMGEMPDFRDLLSPCCESSELFPTHVEDVNVSVISGGFGPNEFWGYMIDMVHALNGHDYDLPGVGSKYLTGGYGRRSGGEGNVRLFPA